MTIQPTDRRRFGHAYESLALKYLRRSGLKLIVRNYQCRAGEIDLIVQDSETIVFVEVRFRNNWQFVSPIESVTPTKRSKIVRCARHFLLHNPKLADSDFRFDIIGISPQRNCLGYKIEWLKSAFTE